MYLTTELETPTPTMNEKDSQKLLEMYDKEFGLEVGSSRRIE